MLRSSSNFVFCDSTIRSSFFFLLTAIVMGFLKELLKTPRPEIAPRIVIEVSREVGTMDLIGASFLDQTPPPSQLLVVLSLIIGLICGSIFD